MSIELVVAENYKIGSVILEKVKYDLIICKIHNLLLGPKYSRGSNDVIKQSHCARSHCETYNYLSRNV